MDAADDIAAAAADQAAGRFEAATRRLIAAVRREPDDPAPRAALAGALFAARRPEAALAVCEEGLARAPGDPALLTARGQVLQSLGRGPEAAALFEAALAVEPQRAEARLGLALIALERGAWDDADALVQPLPASPSRQWLSARTALGRGDAGEARARLEALLAQALPPEQAADARLLLGEALDRLGRPAEAFAAAAEGKAFLRRLYAERAAGGEGELARVRRLTAWVRATPWSGAPPHVAAPDEPAAHVFLLGFPRSGTTLLEQALAGHPDVVALEEAPTLTEPAARFLAGEAGLGALAALSGPDAEGWRARYWAGVRAAAGPLAGKTFVDKAPAETPSLPLIARLFPNAKVLFAVRDPRDVALSCLRQAFQMNALTYAFTDLADTAALYDATMTLAEASRARLPLALREVRHETLVADLAGEIAGVCAWLGLTPHPAMLDVAATAARRTVRTPSAPQVREGLNPRGLGRWRAYAAELAPVLPVLAPWVKRWGYD